MYDEVHHYGFLDLHFQCPLAFFSGNRSQKVTGALERPHIPSSKVLPAWCTIKLASLLTYRQEHIFYFAILSRERSCPTFQLGSPTSTVRDIGKKRRRFLSYYANLVRWRVEMRVSYFIFYKHDVYHIIYLYSIFCY